MKSLLKVLLGLVAALALLMVLAAVLLPYFFDKEDLKEAISAEVYDQTGRKLDINGALDFSVFPWLAVEVSDLSLGNAPGFGDQPQAHIGKARVGVALMPLLRRQISVDEVTLDSLQLFLAVNEKGQNNWDDLATGEPSPNSGETGPGMFSGKRVAGLNIRDSNVEYRDSESGSHYRLGGLSLQAGALGDGEPVPLELKALFEDAAAGRRADIELVTVAAIDLAAQTLQLPAFTLELAGLLSAAGTLSAGQILGDPVINGSLNVAEFSPVELMQALQMDVPATSDPQVLQRASFSTRLSGGSSQLALDDFQMELDQSRITGGVSIQNFGQPKIGFRLTVDQIDLDRYMEPASGENAGTADDVAMPKDELRDQEAQGELEVGILRMAGLEFNDARVGITVKNGRLRLHPLTAGFYGGRYSGDVMLDASGAVALISLDEKVESISFQRLISDLVESESLSGEAFGHVRLAGRGNRSNEVLGSLQGDLGLSLTEGALEGINIWYEIRRGMALYKGLPAPDPEPERTVFSRMQVTGTVEDGVVTARELTGELPFLTFHGNGEIDLVRSQLDLGLVAEVRNTPELAKDPLGSGLSGKSLPFRISGPLDEPSLSVDWEALLKSQATDLLLKKIGLGAKESQVETPEGEEEKASSKNQLEETAKGVLSGLLRKKDKDKDKDKEQDKDDG